MKRRSAFTLIELLVVIAIISLLAAILTPVFSQARGKSYQVTCVSNQRQIGMAVLLYAQDYDEAVPNGINYGSQQRMWPGEGWAGQCLSYLHNIGIFRCPADNTTAQTPQTNVSYGYNYNLVAADPYLDVSDPIPSGILLSDMDSPSRTIMLFEVGGVTVNLCNGIECRDSPLAGSYFSASGNGLDNRLYAHKDWSTGPDNVYATGFLGGRVPSDPTATQFPSRDGRHNVGSTYVMCDGHARWMLGTAVSSGLNALGETCQQDNLDNVPGCGGTFYAAGTSVQTGFQATFATK